MKLALRRHSDRIDRADDLVDDEGWEDLADRGEPKRKLFRKRVAAMPKRRLSDWLAFVKYGRTDDDTAF